MICVSSRWGKPWRCQGREGRSGNDWYARSTKDRLPIEARSPCERCASFAASPPLRLGLGPFVAPIGHRHRSEYRNCNLVRWAPMEIAITLSTRSPFQPHTRLSLLNPRQKEREAREIAFWKDSDWKRKGPPQLSTTTFPPLHPSSPHSVPLFHQKHHILHRRTISHPLTIHHQNRHGLQVLLPSV